MQECLAVGSSKEYPEKKHVGEPAEFVTLPLLSTRPTFDGPMKQWLGV